MTSSQIHFPGPILSDFSKVTFKVKLIFVRVKGKGRFRFFYAFESAAAWDTLTSSVLSLVSTCNKFVLIL